MVTHPDFLSTTLCSIKQLELLNAPRTGYQLAWKKFQIG